MNMHTATDHHTNTVDGQTAEDDVSQLHLCFYQILPDFDHDLSGHLFASSCSITSFLSCFTAVSQA